MDSFLATQGGFKDFSSPHKDVLVSAFTTSFLIHGLVRIFTSRNINNDAFKQLAVLSYVAEMIQAIKLVRVGALDLAGAAPFILGPLGAIPLLLAHKSEKKKD